MKVLVACEFSGVVRDAFAARGHDAWSCDLLPSEAPGQHIRGDILDVLWSPYVWDLMIAHPPCTHLAVSGARWFKSKRAEQADALALVRTLLESPIHKIALENPISVISSKIRKPDQIIQPWQFGHGETKATCLWLKNLPPLRWTHGDPDLFARDRPPIPEERAARVHREPPSPNRWKNRSRTLPGIAAAMAEQWGASGLRGEMSNQGMLMPWGKHKGEPVEDLPTDYIEWLLGNATLGPSLQRELEAQLEGRQGHGIQRGKLEGDRGK